VRNKIEKAMQAAFDEAVEKGVLTPKGLNEHGRTIYPLLGSVAHPPPPNLRS
jgi:hypothetical protein